VEEETMHARLKLVRRGIVRPARAFASLSLTMLPLLCLGRPDQDLAKLAACTHAVGHATVNAVPTYKVDLLFVVDDSQSMQEEQTNLGAQLPELVHVLTSGELDAEHTFNPVDLHVGVVSTDMGGFADDARCRNSKDGIFGSRGRAHAVRGAPSGVERARELPVRARVR
jgi:hypothetical protein